MGVYKRGSVYWYKFAYRGETIRRSTKQGNKRTAEQIEAAHKTALAKGEVGIVQREPAPTLAIFAPRFMAAIRTQCASKPATIRFYELKLRRLLESPTLADRRLDEIDEAAVDTYKQRRRGETPKPHGKRAKAPVPASTIAPATVNRELATLRRLLRLAQEWKIIDRVPRIRLLRGERTREYVLSHELEAAYLAALPDPTASVALLLLDTGLRLAEALLLTWADLCLRPVGEARYGHVTVRSRNAKNSKARHVPLSARVRDMLEALGPQRTGYVFHRPNGAPLSSTNLDHQHAKARAILKQPSDFVLHSLRHTFGTRLGEAGADAFTIMRLMGHSTVTVSQRYVHPSPETVELAFGRMERLNEARLTAARSGVGTNVGTATEADSPIVQ